jgi:hypothetical protein
MGNLAEELLDFTPQCHHLRWLCDHLDGWQFGDQGLIEAIVDAIGALGLCIEYGAGDGEELPLTIKKMMARRPELCHLIEIDASRRDNLHRLYPQSIVSSEMDWEKVSNGFVAVVVIDIDSHDSVVMRDMLTAGVRPELLVVEHLDNHFPIGTTTPDAIPPWMLGLKLQSGHAIQDTAETLHAIANQHGYERIGWNRCNSYFVRGDKFLSLFR